MQTMLGMLPETRDARMVLRMASNYPSTQYPRYAEHASNCFYCGPSAPRQATLASLRSPQSIVGYYGAILSDLRDAAWLEYH